MIATELNETIFGPIIVIAFLVALASLAIGIVAGMLYGNSKFAKFAMSKGALLYLILLIAAPVLSVLMEQNEEEYDDALYHVTKSIAIGAFVIFTIRYFRKRWQPTETEKNPNDEKPSGTA